MQALFYCADFYRVMRRGAGCLLRPAAWQASAFSFAFDAAGFIKADIALVAFLALIDITRLAVVFADLVRSAQAAFHIGATHSRADLLFDDRGAAFTAAQLVAAVILFDANHRQFLLIDLLAAAAAFMWFGQWHRLAATGRRVVSLLQALLVAIRAALAGEGDMPLGIFAAVHG
jgi:hypothetical protein